jgi:hypothetical protein
MTAASASASASAAAAGGLTSIDRPINQSTSFKARNFLENMCLFFRFLLLLLLLFYVVVSLGWLAARRQIAHDFRFEFVVITNESF